jgi:hypothetical protein
MATKKIKVTVTTTKRSKICYSAGNTCPTCPVCCRPVEVLTKAQTISAFPIAENLLENFIKGGLIHLILAENGDDLICSTSLAKTITTNLSLTSDSKHISENIPPGK